MSQLDEIVKKFNFSFNSKMNPHLNAYSMIDFLQFSYMAWPNGVLLQARTIGRSCLLVYCEESNIKWRIN